MNYSLDKLDFVSGDNLDICGECPHDHTFEDENIPN